MGANHGPHRGAQAVVHVHQFQGWPQVGPKNPTENWFPTHRNVTKSDRCVLLFICFISSQKKSLEICIILGFPSFYLQHTSGTFTCNLDESLDIPPFRSSFAAKQLQFLESCLDLVSGDSSQLQRFKSFALGHQE